MSLRGPLRQRLPGTSGTVRYCAYNEKVHCDEQTADECRRHVHELGALERVQSSYVDDFSDLTAGIVVRFDIVILCNALHEIDVRNWPRLFAQVHTVLRDGGVLVVMEDELISVGELPDPSGFIVLDHYAIRDLLSAGVDDVSVLDAAMNGRVKATEVTKRALAAHAKLNIRAALVRVAQRARDEAETIRGQEKTFQSGRALAFWSMLYLNASTALQAFPEFLGA
jgi:SAM-dependent methyltransferase